MDIREGKIFSGDDNNYQKSFIKWAIKEGFKIIPGTLHLVKEGDEGFIDIIVPMSEYLKSNYDNNIEFSKSFIFNISDITKMHKNYFERILILFGIKLI